MFGLGRIAVLLSELLLESRAILKVLRLRTPGLVFLVVVDKVNKGNGFMSKFKLVLPPPGAADVVSRDLTVSISGGEPRVFELTGDVLESQVLEANEGDAITGQLVDVDDAGNNSEARLFDLILVDTIAPPLPGEVGIAMTEE